MLHSELLPFGRNNPLSIDGPPVNVREPRAAALGLALHEMTVNAVKYGCLSTAAGRLSVAWDVLDDGDRLQLVWREDGACPVVVGGRSGFGSLLLDQLLSDQLTVTREWRPSGLLATITLDLRPPPPAAQFD